MKKLIILSPTCTGKTTFEGPKKDVTCNEFLSSHNYKPKGINMGFTGTQVPLSHPLYLSLEEMYKIGVDIFYKSGDKCLVYNMVSHIPWLKNKYNEVEVKIVMVDENIHYERYLKRIKKDKDHNKSFIELAKKSSPLINSQWKWSYILEERAEYKRLSDIFNIKIYKTFEEAYI